MPSRVLHRTLVRVRSFSFVLAFALALLSGCSSQVSPATERPPLAQNEDHTIARVMSLSEFEKYAAPSPGTRELKFVIPYFSTPEYRHVRFLDANFYWFHDEWYWYQLLRGMRVPADTLVPGPDLGFANPGEATAWASREEELPLGLTMVEGRLYSSRFYELSLGKRPRPFGLGSVFHVPARTLPEKTKEVWAFQLEYLDEPRPEELNIYFSLLRNALPNEVTEKLVFVARSPKQHELIRALQKRKHELAPYLKTYSDLVTPGAVEVYSDGITAGYLRIIEKEALSSLTSAPTDILVLPQVPDELPAAAGIITAVPQTPLSHINLLAQNRGIPNLYLGQAEENVELLRLAHDEMPVVIHAQGNSFVVKALDEGIYRQWLELSRGVRRSFPELSADHLPYFQDLRASDFSRFEDVGRSAGGKAAGYLLLVASGVEVPTPAIALSTRAFREHLFRLEPTVTLALTDPAFQKSERIRYLVLEGPEKYAERFGEAEARAFLGTFHKEHPHGALSDLLARGGLRQAIRTLPLEPQFLEHLTARLSARFSSLARTQGLRFRSSSNVEDIEGFNGAGLYESNTGFLDQGAQKKTIEWALKKTWASFFSFAAFEERRNEGIDPLHGGMGVLIHPRFDDEQELSNGVCTLKIDRGAPLSGGRPRYEMLVNVQLGATSVTNAESGVVPQVVRVRSSGEGESDIEFQYVSAATGREERVRALSEQQLTALFRDVRKVGDLWLTQKNERTRPGMERRGVVLDFEFRTMAAGWPSQRSGATPEARVILKQVRPLEPSPPPLPPEYRNAPIPGELLARAVRIETLECRSQNAEVRALRVFTDEASPHDFGYSHQPFHAELLVRPRPGSALPLPTAEFTHRNLEQSDSARAQSAPRTIGSEPSPASPAFAWRLQITDPKTPISEVRVEGGKLEFRGPLATLLDEPCTCRTVPLLDHPDRLLHEALRAP